MSAENAKNLEKSPSVVVERRIKGVVGDRHEVYLPAGTAGDLEGRIKVILVGERKGSTSAASGRVTITKVVRDGLPLKSVERVSKSLGVAESGILEIIGMSPRTYQRRKKDRKSLSAVESDRLYRLAKIEARAIEVFQDEATAIDWLKAPNQALGEAPVEVLDTEAGSDMVERLLTRIEHGVYS